MTSLSTSARSVLFAMDWDSNRVKPDPAADKMAAQHGSCSVSAAAHRRNHSPGDCLGGVGPTRLVRVRSPKVLFGKTCHKRVNRVLQARDVK